MGEPDSKFEPTDIRQGMVLEIPENLGSEEKKLKHHLWTRQDIEALQHGTITQVKSNSGRHVFSYIVTKQYNGHEISAVFKPWFTPQEIKIIEDAYPSRFFHQDPDCEIASYIVSNAMDFDMSPPTISESVVGLPLPDGTSIEVPRDGSLQFWIEGAEDAYDLEDLHYGKRWWEFVEPSSYANFYIWENIVDHLDHSLNENIIVKDKQAVSIDNSFTFHLSSLDPDFQLPQVFLDHSEITIYMINRLNSVLTGSKGEELRTRLSKYLEEDKIAAFFQRIQQILDILSTTSYPDPQP